MEKKGKMYILVALLLSFIEIVIFVATMVVVVVLLYFADPYNEFRMLYKVSIVSYCIVMSIAFTLFRVLLVLYGFIVIKQLYQHIVKNIIRVKNLTLQDVLSNDSLLLGFKAYCLKAHVGEVLQCIIAIRSYKSKETVEERILEYANIVTKFIKPESPQQVNIAYTDMAPLLGFYQYFETGKTDTISQKGEALVEREMRRRRRRERRGWRIGNRGSRNGHDGLHKTKNDMNHFNQVDIKRAKKELYDQCPKDIFDGIEYGLECDLLGHYVMFLEDKGYTKVAKQYVGFKRYMGHHGSAVFYQTSNKNSIIVNKRVTRAPVLTKQDLTTRERRVIEAFKRKTENCIASPRYAIDITISPPDTAKYTLGTTEL